MTLFLQPGPIKAQDILYAQDRGRTVEATTIIRGRWSNRHLSPEARADAALAAMTHQEKIAILNADPIGVPRLGIPGIKETDASLGVSNMGSMRKGFVATALPSSTALRPCGCRQHLPPGFRTAVAGRDGRDLETEVPT